MDTSDNKQGNKVLHLKINNQIYDWHQEYISGAEVRTLGNIPVEDEIYLTIKKLLEDEAINDDKQVNLTRPEIERFYSVSKHFKVELIVNGRIKQWNEKTLTFEQVVVLAFGINDPNPSKLVTVTYDNGPHENPDGSMVRGEIIYVKNKMIFNVTATDKS